MNKNHFLSLLSKKVLILDGAMGTELQKRKYLNDIVAPEELNLKYPERLQAVYKDYLEAGSDIILSNSFGANSHKLKEFKLENKIAEINKKSISIAREVASKYSAYVAADIGPIGAYLKPLGPVTFDDAYKIFSDQIKILASEKPDLLIIETMADIKEVKAAILAAKDNFSGPILAQMTFSSDGASVTGTDVLSFLAVAEGLGVDGIGMNCSVGPDELRKLADLLTQNTSLPISFKPNAGMPKLINRETVFPGTPEEFVKASKIAYQSGVNMLGGCCGTSPAFIKQLSAELKGKKPAKRKKSNAFLISSRTKSFNLNTVKDICKIGERINPTNRKKFQEELLAGNFSTIRKEAQGQVKSGADILDINLGIPGGDELNLMKRAVEEIQEVVHVPLCLDSSSAKVLEQGLKSCAGKPIINSVNGEKEKLDTILPLAKRYGAALIGLTVDERGIPKTANERLEIAEKIINAAKKHGINEKEIIFDYLTLAVSAMPEGIKETLQAIEASKKRWPDIKTILGVSNVSFGMPNRQIINSTFLKLARKAGLDMAILNPHLDWSINDSFAKDLLLGKDSGGEKYIAKHGNVVKKQIPADTAGIPADKKLYNAIVDGSKEEVAGLVKDVLGLKIAPLDISNKILLAALNEVGAKFKNKEYFLPQVILSAEATQAAFTQIRPLLNKEEKLNSGKIILATVKGDVHDIGKNIVAAVLESHGWQVIDLGKNVEAQTILDSAKKENTNIVGLSALMTTTMPEMENIIKAKNSQKLTIKIIVGGAPVTDKYAKEIGADGYAKDAVEAAELLKTLKA